MNESRLTEDVVYRDGYSISGMGEGLISAPFFITIINRNY